MSLCKGASLKCCANLGELWCHKASAEVPYVASMGRTVSIITHLRPGGDLVKFYSSSGFRIEFSFWSRPQLSKGL